MWRLLRRCGCLTGARHGGRGHSPGRGLLGRHALFLWDSGLRLYGRHRGLFGESYCLVWGWLLRRELPWQGVWPAPARSMALGA